MHQTAIEVSTPRGVMPVHLNRPESDDPAPLVILYMDAVGLRPALHAHAERLVAAGYATALPDLFYAIAADEHPNEDRLRAGDPDEFARMGAVVAQIDDAAVMQDTRLMLTALPGGADAPWGCVGFCLGGRLGLRAAEAFGDELAAAALLHPSGLVTDAPDSPHRLVSSVTGALYLGFGELDHVTPVSTIPPLREQLEQHAVAHTIAVLSGADHGFTMPGMPAYDETAAEQAWAGTLALLDQRLGATG